MTAKIDKIATIHIADLKIPAIIGTKPKERDNPQEIIISIWVRYNAEKAAKTDSLNTALDYQALRDKVFTLVKCSRFKLMEGLARSILQTILENPQVICASVRISKPKALRNTNAVSLELSGRNS